MKHKSTLKERFSSFASAGLPLAARGCLKVKRESLFMAEPQLRAHVLINDSDQISV